MKKYSAPNGNTMAMVVNFDELQETTFLTANENEFQLGVGVLPAEHKFIPHVHKDVERRLVRTSEFIFVMDGELQIDLIDENESMVERVLLKKNHALLQFFGGHDIRSTEKTKYFELKQGPYLGRDADKYQLEESWSQKTNKTEEPIE